MSVHRALKNLRFCLKVFVSTEHTEHRTEHDSRLVPAIMDANSAATGDMLSMATLRPRNETEQERVLCRTERQLLSGF